VRGQLGPVCCDVSVSNSDLHCARAPVLTAHRICLFVVRCCRAACAATAAINSPLRLGNADQASSLLVLINAPQDSTTAEVSRPPAHGPAAPLLPAVG
jgi:hypothetical protein